MCGVKVYNNNLQPLFSFSASRIKRFFWLKCGLQQMSEASKKKPTKKRKLNSGRGFRQTRKKSLRAMLASRAIILLLDVHLGTGSKLDSFVRQESAFSEVSLEQITSQDQTVSTSRNPGHSTTHPLSAPLCSSLLDNESLRFEEPMTQQGFCKIKKKKRGRKSILVINQPK